MTRTVFDNAMTAHVWANQGAPEGRSNNGNFYFNGRRLYSYGSHFLAGIILPGVGPVLTADTYSITTARHMSEARHATSHRAPAFPGLTGIADDLDALAWANASTGETARHYRVQAANARKRLTAYLESNAARLSEESGALALRLMGSRATWESFKARALAKAERKAAAARKACVKLDRKRAAEYAAIPLPLFRLRALGMLDSWNAARLDSHIRETVAAHKAAGGPRIKAAVWARLKALRSIRKQWEANKENAATRAALAALRRIAAGDYAAGAPLERFPTGRRRAWEMVSTHTDSVLRGAHMPGTIRAKLERQREVALRAAARLERREERREEKRRARERLAQTVQSLRRWRDQWREESPDQWEDRTLPQHLRDASPISRERTLGAIERDLSAFVAAGRFPALAARLEALRAESVSPLLETARMDREGLDAAERERRTAWLALPADERRETWRRGESIPSGTGRDLETAETGPLLRAHRAEIDGCTIKAGELETSQGATVPLRHAFRVFQFIAACRRAGQPWRPVESRQRGDGLYMPGPSAIRVGHFRVDKIDATGDFVAGCHSIRWTEVQRLAERLGVADCVADVETISGELESVN